MSDIKRYDTIGINKLYSDAVRSEHGQFVKYTDHQRQLDCLNKQHQEAIQQARMEAKASAVREFAYWLKREYAAYSADLTQFPHDAELFIEQLEKAEGLSKSCDSSHLKEQGE